MSVPRVYQPVSLNVNTSLSLTPNAAHHVARVLRAKIGDALMIFNGKQGEYRAIIKSIDKKAVVVMLTDFQQCAVESSLDITLAQGIARGEKMDFIIQKAVELGVSKFIPLITTRSNVRWEKAHAEKRLQHWRSVAISASEQSGRDHVPEIVDPLLFTEWLPTAAADYCFVLSPHVKQSLPTNIVPQSVLLLIGPEGGLSTEEIAAATERGFCPLQLGPRVLRTETATLAALTVLQFAYGDLSATSGNVL